MKTSREGRSSSRAGMHPLRYGRYAAGLPRPEWRIVRSDKTTWIRGPRILDRGSPVADGRDASGGGPPEGHNADHIVAENRLDLQARSRSGIGGRPGSATGTSIALPCIRLSRAVSGNRLNRPHASLHVPCNDGYR